jgi:hypothetical protein
MTSRNYLQVTLLQQKQTKTLYVDAAPTNQHLKRILVADGFYIKITDD